MMILGIETTCDETACALVREGREILSNSVSSQVDLHREFGGVVPELACRRHVDLLLPVLSEALSEAKLPLGAVDAVAVSKGPGLIGALLVGINAAKALSLALKKPLFGINHVEAHLYAALMSHELQVDFPCLGVVLSGGHTALVYMREPGEYELLGQTADDALGEAFDKAAKILGLPYPGGPCIEALAREGDPDRFPLQAGRVKGRPLDFSFSGIKTAVLYAAKGAGASIASPLRIGEQEKKDLAASFQRAAFADVEAKVKRAAEEKGCSRVVFGGGVTANRYLRKLFSRGLSCYFPSPALSLDNAAMIAGLAYRKFLKNPSGEGLEMEPSTQLRW